VSTLRSVANVAGVSVATVSRVISRSTSVAPATRTRVLHAIAELQYEPNAIAKNLRTGRSMRLLVCASRFSGPFVPTLLEGIERGGALKGYSLLLVRDSEEGARANRCERILRDAEADGLIVILSGPGNIDHLEAFAVHARPCLAITPRPTGPKGTVRTTVRDLYDVGERCACALVNVIERRAQPSAALEGKTACWIKPGGRQLHSSTRAIGGHSRAKEKHVANLNGRLVNSTENQTHE